MTINLNKCTKSSFTKVIKAIPKHIADEATIIDIVYLTCQSIATKAYFKYQNAMYNGGGFIDKTMLAPKPIGDAIYKPKYAQRGFVLPDKGITWSYKEKVGEYVANYSTFKWAVITNGTLPIFLEFGSGDRYSSGGYSDEVEVGKGTFSANPQAHFISKEGLDTWVYKGEQGKNPYPDGQPKDSKGRIREGYYYSSGNEPTRALYYAVQETKQEFKTIVAKAHWSHWY